VHLSSYLGPHGAGLLEEDAMDRGLRRYLTARKVRQRQVTGKWTGLLYSLCCGTDHRENEWQYCPHCVERWHRQRGYYRDRSPLDCGRTHCGVCASRKRWRMGRTRAELKARVSAEEQEKAEI